MSQQETAGLQRNTAGSTANPQAQGMVVCEGCRVSSGYLPARCSTQPIQADCSQATQFQLPSIRRKYSQVGAERAQKG